MTMQDEQVPIDPRLRDALREVARADDDSGVSPVVELHLRDALRVRRVRRHSRRWQLAWLATAATIVILVASARWHTTTTPQVATPGPATAPAIERVDTTTADFLPLAYAHVPASNGQIVQIVVPAAAMASFGLDPSSVGTDAVTADVLVGEDGLARAVRFSPFTRKELVQ